jgi:hypothetical protein
MTSERAIPPQRVPVLTEVVRLSDPQDVDTTVGDGGAVAAVAPTLLEPGLPAPYSAGPVASTEDAAPVLSAEQELIERVLADLQRQVDLMLEYRIRETLTPILARTTDAVVRDTRQQLASTLREMVARAVAQELTRHRTS